MRLRAVVLGIPGVGKTTVVQRAASSLKGGRLVNFGTVMFSEAMKLRWIKHRDELRKLPVGKQRRLQRIAARTISRMKGDVLFVDTHLFIRTPEGFWPGLPFEVARALKPTHLVLVEASSHDVFARRSRDATRYRETSVSAASRRGSDAERESLTRSIRSRRTERDGSRSPRRSTRSPWPS